MPFKSKQQAKWMFAKKPAMAKRWAKETPSIKALPKKVTKSHAKRNSKKQKGKSRSK
jgi:hypothetical protein